MLFAIKSAIHASVPYLLYIGLWVVVVLGAVKRAEWALYMLILLVPLPNVWYQIQEFPLGTHTIDLLTISVFIGISTNRGGFQVPPRFWLVLLITLITYMGLWNASFRFNLPLPLTLDNPDVSEWKNYVEMVFLYVLAYNVARTEKEQRVIMILIAVIIFITSLREARSFGAGASFSYENRAAGPFWKVGLGANHFAAFLADFAALLFGLGLVVKDVWLKRVCLAAAAMALYPLLFAYSRGAYLGTIAALLVFGFLRVRSILVVLVALGLTWQAILPTTVVERITMTKTTDGQIEESAAQRLVMWDHAMNVFHNSPVFGVGFSGFKYTHPPLGLTDTHNYYIKVAVDTGVIGLFVMGLILICAPLSCLKLYRRAKSSFHEGLAFGLMGCIASLMITNIFGDRWSYYILGAYFWIAWGLVDRGNAIAATATEPAPALATPSGGQDAIAPAPALVREPRMRRLSSIRAVRARLGAPKDKP